MKILFIGGTGIISTAISERLLAQGHELWLLTRGTRKGLLAGARELTCDIRDEAAAAKLLEGQTFDAVADFIAYGPAEAERDFRLFAGKTRQYIFISSASAYQKPTALLPLTESTPLVNPYWDYSRQKAACEELLLRQLERRKSWAGALELAENRNPRFILLSALACAGFSALCVLSHPALARLPREIYFPCLGAAFLSLGCLVYFVIRQRRGE